MCFLLHFVDANQGYIFIAVNCPHNHSNNYDFVQKYNIKKVCRGESGETPTLILFCALLTLTYYKVPCALHVHVTLAFGLGVYVSDVH